MVTGVQTCALPISYASRQRAGRWRASLSRIAPVSDQARLEAPTSTTSETAGSSARLALPALGTKLGAAEQN